MRPTGVLSIAARLAAGSALVLIATAGVAVAAPEDLANDISREVMSPYCPGVTLHDCPSGAAIELRERIVGWARAGWSKDRIMDELVAEYGETIRAVPPAEGSGLLAWILPAAGLATAIGIGVFVLRRFGPGSVVVDDADVPNGPPSVSMDERARVAAELEAHRSRT